MSTTTVLRDYALIADPASIPLSVRLSHTAQSVAIFDAYPKGIFHILILPRIISPLTVTDLANLRGLLKNKKQARAVLLDLAEHAKSVKAIIEEEMVSRYGFKWGVWTGFHAVPSLTHVHLHLISNDLCGPALTTKRHYNTFHPKIGFFLHLDEVLQWFDADPSYYDSMSKLDPKPYELLTKEDLACWRCGSSMKNMPTLVNHLLEEWRKEAKRSRARSSEKHRGSAGIYKEAVDQMKMEID